MNAFVILIDIARLFFLGFIQIYAPNSNVCKYPTLHSLGYLSVVWEQYLNAFSVCISLVHDIGHNLICVWVIWYCLLYELHIIYEYTTPTFLLGSLVLFSSIFRYSLYIREISLLLEELRIFLNALLFDFACGFLQCRYFKSPCCWICQYSPLWFLGFDS